MIRQGQIPIKYHVVNFVQWRQWEMLFQVANADRLTVGVQRGMTRPLFDIFCGQRDNTTDRQGCDGFEELRQAKI